MTDTTAGSPGSTEPSGDRDSGADSDARVDAIRFVTGHVSDEEAAAVTAVLLAALDEAAGPASLAEEPRRDAWVRSGHALRSPIEVGRGAWTRSAR
jgi:hypothetical protein